MRVEEDLEVQGVRLVFSDGEPDLVLGFNGFAVFNIRGGELLSVEVYPAGATDLETMRKIVDLLRGGSRVESEC